MLLTKLASFYWRPDFGPSQAAVMTADFVEDLVEFPVCEVEQALQEYRRDPKSKFFPTPGAIRQIILDARKERAAMEKLGPSIRGNFESRPIRWWSLPKKLWRSHWREEDIPEEHRGQYETIKALRRNTAANDVRAV